MSAVRFVCTDDGRHPASEVGRWTLGPNGLAQRVDLPELSDDDAAPALFMRAEHRNARYIARVKAQGAEQALATFDERCPRPRCKRRFDQIGAERFAKLVAGLMAAGCTEFDVSRPKAL